MRYGWGWKPYVPVARRRAKAMQQMEKLRKKGQDIQPVHIEGRQIARTFWGKSWCEHLEKFSDFDNRLPRGRTYVRNGSVCHLEIHKGRIAAKVSGSSIYNVEIKIKALAETKWRQVKNACAGRVGSLLELLQGKLSDQVMCVVTDKERGLFPQPKEITLACSCPDWATMCKHVAAVLYGVGARLDEKPELLFVLRGVDHTELVGAEAAKVVTAKSRTIGRKTLAESELSDVFGIDVAPVTTEKQATVAKRPAAKKKPKAAKAAVRKTSTGRAKPGAKTKSRSSRSSRGPESEATGQLAAKTSRAKKSGRKPAK
jgi:uncharacterized Zn finger protein